MFCHIWCLWNRNCYHIIFSMIWKEFVIFCHIWTEFGTAMELCRSDHLRPWTPARVSASPFLRGNSSSNGSFMTEYQRLDARQVPQVGRLSCWKLKAKKNNKLYLSFRCSDMCVHKPQKRRVHCLEYKVEHYPLCNFYPCHGRGNRSGSSLAGIDYPMPRSLQATRRWGPTEDISLEAGLTSKNMVVNNQQSLEISSNQWTNGHIMGM
jgi:hypothetical protein